MPVFSLNRPLTSCQIDKTVLLELQEYLEHTFDPGDRASPPAEFRVSIEDSFGTEYLTSVQELRASGFSDSTKSVQVAIRNHSGKGVSVTFANDALLSRITMDTEGPNARETALGLYEGVIRILEPKRTSASLFYPPPFVEGVLVGSMPLLVGTAVVFMVTGKMVEQVVSFIIILIVFVSFAGKKLNPYAAFANRQNERLQHWWGWFVGGTATFVVFGTLLTIFRKKLFGF